MRRIVISSVVVVLLLAIAGYTGGFFTGETRREESCALCRALRFTGRHYGFPYERIEDSVLTVWYRQTIDPAHGKDPSHPHQWMQSGCTVNAKPGDAAFDYACGDIPPIFMLRPETELAVLTQIPDKETQAGLIQALAVPDRTTAAKRIKHVIDYYYVEQNRMTWPDWWRQHAGEFGMVAPPPVQATLPSH
jgi:hypothetical protein